MAKKNEKLSNGAYFIAHQLKKLHSVTISISFRTGTLYENEKNNGITHLIEHLFFRRLSDLSQELLYLKMQRIGAEIIGKTYCDYVNFTITVVPKYFSDALDLMMKFFDDFEWNNTEITDEKEVVFRQIENRGLSYEKWLDDIYFESTKYTFPIMGTYDTVLSLTKDEINLWKKMYFSLQNSCISITSAFSDDDYVIMRNTLNQIQNFHNCGDNRNKVIELPINFCSRKFENQIHYENSDSELCEVTINFDIDESIKYEKARLLSSILGEGCGSKLSIRMREKQFLTDDIYTNLTSYCGFHRISVSYSVRNEKIYSSLVSLFSVLKELKNNISENEYLSSILFFTDNQLMDLDDCKKLNDEYVLCDFVLGILPSEPEQKAEVYRNIKICDLINTAKELFVKENISFIIESSLKKEIIENMISDILSVL